MQPAPSQITLGAESLKCNPRQQSAATGEKDLTAVAHLIAKADQTLIELSYQKTPVSRHQPGHGVTRSLESLNRYILCIRV